MVRLSRTPFKSDFSLSRTVFFGPFRYKTPLKSEFFEFRMLKVRKFETNILKSKQLHCICVQIETSFFKNGVKAEATNSTLTEKYNILKEIDNVKKCAAAIRD